MKKNEIQKTIVVTGASSGIGRAISQKILDVGHRVIGLARYRKFSPITNDQFIAEEIDFSNLGLLPDRLDVLVRKYPEVNAVVLVAGKGRFGSLEEFSYKQIRELMDLNFVSTAFLVKAFLPVLKKRKSGHIICLGSESALKGEQKGSIYCASKFAIRGMVQALRAECAKNNVHVSLINPGMVQSKFFDQLNFEPGEDAANFLTPEDIADAVSYVLNSPSHGNIDEINLSPQKHVVRSKPKK